TYLAVGRARPPY
ncbi:hypothetical protein D018_1345B, partial [Vibrio parahaemolyticus VP2007-007]